MNNNIEKLMNFLDNEIGEDPEMAELRQKAEAIVAEKKRKADLVHVFAAATQHRPVFKHKQTRYTIDNGCKIEMSADGDVRIYNTRTGGDFYEHLSPYYYELFAKEGFEVGSLQLSIDTLGIMLKKIEHRTEKKFEIEKKNLKDKINDYKNQIAFYKKGN